MCVCVCVCVCVCRGGDTLFLQYFWTSKYVLMVGCSSECWGYVTYHSVSFPFQTAHFLHCHGHESDPRTLLVFYSSPLRLLLCQRNPQLLHQPTQKKDVHRDYLNRPVLFCLPLSACLHSYSPFSMPLT